MAFILDCCSESIKAAACRLLDGRLVAFPTETVYGLGGSAYTDQPVLGIYAVKNRPSRNPLISHYASATDVWEDVVPSRSALRLAEAFWPGPMTLVLKRREYSRISNKACAGLDTAAVRVPIHEIAHKLILETGIPIVAPSANKSTHLSTTTAEMVLNDFIYDDLLILDGGPCKVGIESTIIDATDDNYVTILRYGIITEEDIAKVCNVTESTKLSDKPIAPGMMFKHYSPQNHQVIMNALECGANDGYIDFGPMKDVKCRIYRNLSPISDLNEAATNLFKIMYELDASDCKSICIAPIPYDGIGIAINDKIRRASGGVGLLV